MNLSHINTSFTNTSFGPHAPKNTKPLHHKKQAPLSLITNPNAVFVKTKIGDIASFYKEASLKISHNKKASLVLHGIKPKPFIHSKHKTNITSDLSIHLNTTFNNKTHDIINTNTTKHINTHVHNKTHITNYIRTKPKHSAVSVCKDKEITHKKINSTFQVVNHNLNKTKGGLVSTNYNSNSLRHSSCNRETENNVSNVNKTMINQPIKKTKIKNTKALSKHIITKVAKQSILPNKTRIKQNGLLEIKTTYELNEDNNNTNKNKNIPKQIPSSTKTIPIDKIGTMNLNTKQSTRMKTESNDFSSCNKFENKNINMNNNYFSIKNKPKDKKHPPKRPNKLLKCPFKLNLLDIINENTKNGNTLPNNFKSLTKRTKKHKNKSISSVHNNFNNNIIYDTMENILEEQYNKKNLMNTSTYEDEENEYGDLNSIVKKINFKVNKDSIFNTEENIIYESYCKKFESKYENIFNYKHDNNKIHMYKRVSNSGSTCDNSSKKYHVTKGIVYK